MASKDLHETKTEREKAILVGVERPDAVFPVQASLEELERLADTAGADIVGVVTQRLDTVNPRTFVGSGKAHEVGQLASHNHANIVIFDDELTPSQQANLEKILPGNIKVIDRTALILDIFALHANTKEGRLQVQLAQNQYLYPRLRGMWADLMTGKMGGGVGSRFGAGENKLEIDRRNVRKRITAIRRELKELERTRTLQREARYSSGTYKIALAGYTNAGKSCLLNTLTNAEVLSYDKLFATLDSTTRQLVLPEGRQVTLTDTVGFIRKLPTTLVEAFKSTLDEINGADLILHVIDASSDEKDAQMQAVETVLEQIHADEIPRINVFNKCDLLTDAQIEVFKNRYNEGVFISAHTGAGIDDLIEHISFAASSQETYMELLIPYSKGDLVSLLHEQCRVVNEEYDANGTKISAFISKYHYDKFAPYRLQDDL